MNCGVLIKFINDLPKDDFYNSTTVVTRYRNNIKQFNVTREFIKQLDMEYDRLCRMSNEYRSSPKTLIPKCYNHYIRTENGNIQAVYFNS